ncbi:hypothetical protein [Pelagibacterium mangrovi]|uniref:hypothetical protein n=1 Tax=Pelagibacterium mangrovi TaxID=3119828 RepID=UPI002FC5822A
MRSQVSPELIRNCADAWRIETPYLMAMPRAFDGAACRSITQQITERLDRVVVARRHYSQAPIDFRPLIGALRENQPDAAEAASRNNVHRMRSIVINHILRAESFANSRILTGI